MQKNDFDRKEPSQGSKPAEKGAINLIDFDDFGSLPPANSSSNPQDDVLGGIASLNFGAPVHNQFGQPNQFTQQTQFTPPVNQFAAPQQYMQQQPNQFVQPQLNQFNQPQLTGQGQFTPQQMPLNTQMSGGFDAFSGFGSQKPVSQTQPQQQKAASPFDDLLSMNDLKPAQNNSAPTQKNDLLGLFDCKKCLINSCTNSKQNRYSPAIVWYSKPVNSTLSNGHATAIWNATSYRFGHATIWNTAYGHAKYWIQLFKFTRA